MKRIITGLLLVVALLFALGAGSNSATGQTGIPATVDTVNNANGTTTVTVKLPNVQSYGTLNVHLTLDSNITAIWPWLTNQTGQVSKDLYNGAATPGQVITYVISTPPGTLTNFTGWRLLSLHATGTGYNDVQWKPIGWLNGTSDAANNNYNFLP